MRLPSLIWGLAPCLCCLCGKSSGCTLGVCACFCVGITLQWQINHINKNFFDKGRKMERRRGQRPGRKDGRKEGQGRRERKKAKECWFPFFLIRLGVPPPPRTTWDLIISHTQFCCHPSSPPPGSLGQHRHVGLHSRPLPLCAASLSSKSNGCLRPNPDALNQSPSNLLWEACLQRTQA